MLTVTVGVSGGNAVAARAKRKIKRITIGKAGLSDLPAGKATRVKFKLNATGRRLLKRGHGKLRATAQITSTLAGRTTIKSAKLKLRRL
ncbi:MAG TPA: hypothetical protein VFN75_07745 [Pseudonocardiaceae bacterium]|nr:hypothetical protein [Pseudonocardiaceae bacterium]